MYLTTKNPARKMKKKIRQEEARGHTDKVSELKVELTTYQKRCDEDQRKKELKMRRNKVVTEDEAFKDAVKYNKALRGAAKYNKDELMATEKAIKERKREIILAVKEARKKQKEDDENDQRLGLSMFKEKEALTNEHIQKHAEHLKEVKSEEFSELHQSIYESTKCNKKKTKKKYNKVIKQSAQMIEHMILTHMNEGNLTYEKSKEYIYGRFV